MSWHAPTQADFESPTETDKISYTEVPVHLRYILCWLVEVGRLGYF